MQIVKPLVPVVATMEVNFINIDCSSVVVAARRFLTICLRLASTDKVVQVKHI
jgi:hypothetical protein